MIKFIDGWIDEWILAITVGKWIYEWMDDHLNEWNLEQNFMAVWMNKFITISMDDWMNEQVNAWISK